MNTRREFIGGSLFALTAAGLPHNIFGSTLGERRLRLGVISDVHVCGGFKEGVCPPEFLKISCEMSRRAFKWFDEQGVDAVAVPGDIADLGRVAELQAFADTWNEIFPKGRGADGRPVEHLFIYGNHESYVNEARGSRAIWAEGRDAVWREVFGEPFADLRVKTVKGIDFILASWGWESAQRSIGGGYKRFEELAAKSAKRCPVFFELQHPHLKDTCHGPYAWGHDEGVTARILSRYRNAIALSGHSHYLLTDERTVWQGSFTSIGCGSLKYSGEPVEDYPPNGFENTVADSSYNTRFAPGVRAAIDSAKIMPRMNRGPKMLARGNQGMIIDVYDSKLIIRRREFNYGYDLGELWEVPMPAHVGGPFDHAVREKATPLCQFAQGAKAFYKRSERCYSRDYIEHEVHKLTVPGGAATTGSPLVAYEVGYVNEQGKWNHLQFVCADDFNLPKQMKAETMVIPVRSDRLPNKSRLAVKPLDCFHRAGSMIFCEETV